MMMLSSFVTLFVLQSLINISNANSIPSTTVKSSGCGAEPFITPGVSKRIFINVNDPTFGIIERAYRILIPTDYNSTTAHKFLFDFHGLYMNANQEEKESHIEMLSGYGVILVWPNGSNDSESGIRCWNAVGMSNNTGPKGYVCDRDRLR